MIVDAMHLKTELLLSSLQGRKCDPPLKVGPPARALQRLWHQGLHCDQVGHMTISMGVSRSSAPTSNSGSAQGCAHGGHQHQPWTYSHSLHSHQQQPSTVDQQSDAQVSTMQHTTLHQVTLQVTAGQLFGMQCCFVCDLESLFGWPGTCGTPESCPELTLHCRLPSHCLHLQPGSGQNCE
jgi:hypothetical protein